MTTRPPLLAGFFVLLTLLAVTGPAYGADWDTFPGLEGRQHVAVKKRFDGPRYDDLRSCYRRFDSRVGASYFGALVDVTAEDGSRSRKHADAGPYAASLFEHWQTQGRVDADTSIVVVLGVQNRSFGLHVGQKWQRLGFTGGVIDAAIDASHFPKLQRQQSYVEAMCSLATVIDLRLANLEREMAERVTALKERLPALDEKLTDLTEKVAGSFPGKHPLGDSLRASLKDARSRLDEATKLVEKTPTEAVRLADEVQTTLAPVGAELARFNADVETLTTLEADLAALEREVNARPDRHWPKPQAALAQLNECKGLADQIRQHYEGRPWEVRDCQRTTEKQLRQADVHYFYLSRVLPPVGFVALITLLVGFVVARRRRRRRALRQLTPDLDEWRRRTDQMTRRLDTLAEQWPELFDAARDDWRGESAELDHRVREAWNRVLLLLSKARSILQRAEQLRDKSHALDARRLEEALYVLRETPVLEAVALVEAYDVDASRMLGAMDVAFRRLEERFDEIEQVGARLADAAPAANEAMVRAAGAVATRRRLGLPAEHFAKPLEAAMDAWRQATGLADIDPVRALSIFEACTPRFVEVSERAERGNRVVEGVQGELAEMAEAIEQEIRRLRFVRIDLDKLSFHPARELEMANARAVRLVKLVAAAREDEACAAFDALRADLARLTARLDAVARAREGVPERLAALEERRDELKTRLLQTRYVLRLLIAETDSEALRLEAARLSKYHARLNKLSTLFTQPERLHAQGCLLLASERVDALEQLCADAEAFVDALAHVDQAFEEAKDQALQLVETCQPLVRELQLRAKDDQMSPTMRELIVEQAVSFRLVRDAARDHQQGQQPNWLDARDELLCLHRTLTFLEAESAVDLGEDAPAEESEAGMLRREFLRAQVHNLSFHATERVPLSAASLGSASSWSESVATVAETA